MDKILFQKITITQIQYINVQQILVVTFEFTGAARGFMSMSCAARGVKKVGQRWYRTCFCSMPYARSLTLIFSDDGRFDYFRFDYILADLYCCATSVNIERLVTIADT